MVGVAGRSKACHTCRQRRIKCSAERPECAQCVKSRRACGGYQRERIFIGNNESTEEALRASIRKTSSKGASPLEEKNDGVVLRPERAVCAHASSPGYQAPVSSPHMDISPYTALRQQFLNEFICSFVPAAERAGGPPSFDDEKSLWFMLLPGMETLTKALEVSMIALCTAKAGRLHKDELLVKEGIKLYGRGLMELQKALWDPNLMYKDETLAACLALSMYEVFECPAGDMGGWINHQNGCAELMKLRGPYAHSSGLAHKVFLALRPTAIMQSLSKHQSTYLGDSQWRRIPWQNSPKRPIDRFIDLLAFGASIFEQSDALSTLEPPQALQAAMAMVDQCWELDAELQSIYEELERTTAGPLYWPEFAKYDNPADNPKTGKLFPVAYQFANIRTAKTCLLYWSVSFILWSGLSSLYNLLLPLQCSSIVIEPDVISDRNEDLLSPKGFKFRKLRPLEHRSDFISAARSVCQSFEYCIQEEMSSYGPSVASLPLNIVAQTLNEKDYPQYWRERAWAEAALDEICARGIRLLGAAKKNLVLN